MRNNSYDDMKNFLSYYSVVSPKKKKYTRNKFKDSIAAAIIFGGVSIAEGTIFAAAVAAGLLTKGQSRSMKNHLMKGISAAKKEMWSYYKQTGDLYGALCSSERTK